MDEKLEHVLHQVKLLCEQNPEFKDKLMRDISPSSFLRDERSESISEDFASVMRLQHERCRRKARYYYRNIMDVNLRTDLVNDYAQMLWYKSIFEIGKYFVYVNYQLENMLNYYLSHTDFYRKVEVAPQKYLTTLVFSPKYKIDIDVFSYSFNKNDGRPLEISKIKSLWAKILYWAIDTEQMNLLESNKSNFNAIISIRNEENHANSESRNSAVSYWQSQEDGLGFAFIEAIVKQVRNSIINIQ